MARPRLSVLIVTQNQAHQIAECLESVAWADEIVVVDANSSDGTAEIARSRGARVIQHPWRGFAEQRKVALEHATGEWCLAVDSDERVTPELRLEIEEVLRHQGHGRAGFYIARKSFFLNRWIRHAGWYPGYQLRLFRRDLASVTERNVHEGFVVRGSVGYLRSPMLHFTQPTLQVAYDRVNVYTSLEARDRLGRKRVRPRDFVLHPLSAFLRKYVSQKGLLDGLHGFVLSAISALYNMLLYMKVWELQHKDEIELAHRRIDAPYLDETRDERTNVAPVSVLVVARNEEQNIQACLRSARWAKEIVVVDTGSSDRTVDLAGTLADKVLRRPWRGYARTKQEALPETSYDWVFWLDADERFTPELAAEISSTLAKPQHAAYAVPRQAYFLGRWIKHSGWYPGYVTRLFRKDRARFGPALVHEGLEVEGTVGRLKSPLVHITDRTLEHYMRKFNRYTSLAAEELDERGRQFHTADLFTHPAGIFLRMFFLRAGFLDGAQGLMLALLSSAYVFAKYAKLWERQCIWQGTQPGQEGGR